MTIKQLAIILKNEVSKGNGDYPIYFREGRISFPVITVSMINEGNLAQRLEMTWLKTD
jgi:hypothetical protein